MRLIVTEKRHIAYTISMMHRTFAKGDRIVHLDKPEWGTGTVQKTRTVSQGGAPVQIVTVRFSSAGVKSLSTTHARLGYESELKDPMVDHAAPAVMTGSSPEEHKAQSMRDRMLMLPEDTRDPFLPLEKRIKATVRLYRFDDTPRSLIDWGVAQSGLVDPLSEFRRHELEQLFEFWARERDARLGALLNRLKREDKQKAQQVISELPPAALKALDTFSI